MPIRLLGTSHISSKSITAIRREIKDNSFDVVAVELDIGRAQSLQSKERSGIPWQMLPKIGLFGFIFVILGRFVQQHLGKIVGVEPGSEMKEALIRAHKAKAKIALIDRPIQKTLRSFSQQFTWREKLRMFWDLISGPFVGRQRVEEMGISSFDLSGVPGQDTIVQMTGYIKKRYPGMYKALISERDIYMSRALIHILKKHSKIDEDSEKDLEELETKDPLILAVVGAGHLAGMKKYLKKRKVDFDVVDY